MRVDWMQFYVFSCFFFLFLFFFIILKYSLDCIVSSDRSGHSFCCSPDFFLCFKIFLCLVFNNLISTKYIFVGFCLSYLGFIELLVSMDWYFLSQLSNFKPLYLKIFLASAIIVFLGDSSYVYTLTD